MINFPNKLEAFKTALKKGIEHYSKNPATNKNKLNEAVASALNAKSYNVLVSSADNNKPSALKLKTNLNPYKEKKDQRYIGTYHVAKWVADMFDVKLKNDPICDEFEPLNNITSDIYDEYSVKSWLNNLRVLEWSVYAIKIESNPYENSRLAMFVDSDKEPTETIRLYAQYSNVGEVEHLLYLSDFQDHEKLVLDCIEWIKTVNKDVPNFGFCSKDLSNISEVTTIDGLVNWLEFSNPTYSIYVLVFLEILYKKGTQSKTS